MVGLHQFVAVSPVCLGLVSGQASTQVYLGRLGTVGGKTRDIEKHYEISTYDSRGVAQPG